MGPALRTHVDKQEILARLDAVTTELDVVSKERAKEASILRADFESEREARRGWQDKAVTLRQQLSSMVRSTLTHCRSM